MTSKKHYIFVIICVLSCSAVFAQELHREISTQQYSSSFPEALKIDISKPFEAGLFFSPPSRNNRLSRQPNNGWYPIKGEYYYVSETEVAGYSYYEIGQNGLLDKEIIMGVSPDLYDSTVYLMNRTSYSKEKNLVDTVYNYVRQLNGSYQAELRRTYSYHYFDRFEADSFYYETTCHVWNDGQWNNWTRDKMGFHDTLVEFINRAEGYSGYGGDTWDMTNFYYCYQTYDLHGFIDTLYVTLNGTIRKKITFIYDEQGRCMQMNFYINNGNDNWFKIVYSDITWTEWHGNYYNDIAVIGGELLTPYKRNKINSYYVDDRETFFYFYQKQWDINGTRSNSDTTWYIIDSERYYATINDHVYNEYGDHIKSVQTHYSRPDENNEQEMEYSGICHKITYDETYGMTSHMTYIVNLRDSKIDSTFFYGFKYTEFATVSIVEHPQPSKQTLSIYPNPASGAVIIAATAEIEQLRVFDITGRLVSDQSPASRQIVFDTGVLPNGIYLVQARLRDGRVQTGKLVVRP
ncbi:MAG: T9SS type A sorting domain-containing protein [Bacteroidales bacterium]|nr:T9SS type A sorting domain-containing protein [Bacteroidales bacterium]